MNKILLLGFLAVVTVITVFLLLPPKQQQESTYLRQIPELEKNDFFLAVIPQNLSDPLSSYIIQSASNAADRLSQKYGNITVLFDAPSFTGVATEETVNQQARILNDFILQKVDGIAVSCLDAEALKPVIDGAAKHRIPIITFQSDSPDSQRIFHLGADAKETGIKIAEAMVHSMSEETSFGVVYEDTFTKGTLTAIDEGINFIIESNQLKITKIDGEFLLQDPNLHIEIQKARRTYPALKAWIFLGNPDPVADLVASNLYPFGSATVITTSALPKWWNAIETGSIHAAVMPRLDAWGAESVSALMDIIVNNKVFRQSNATPVDIVSSENLRAYQQRWGKWFGDETAQK